MYCDLQTKSRIDITNEKLISKKIKTKTKINGLV